MVRDIVRILIEKINRRPLGEEDRQILEQWLSEAPMNRQLYEEVMDEEFWKKQVQIALAIDRQAIWEKIREGIRNEAIFNPQGE